MTHPLFTGVCTAMVTPFSQGHIDDTMFEKLLIRQIQAGVRAVVISGTTGEAPTLSDAEKLHLFHLAKQIAQDQCLILAGTGCNDTRRTTELSAAAEQAGADGLLVVCPYYSKPVASGIFAHFRTVAERVEIPVIVYNVPSRTGVDIPVSVYRELSEIRNIAGVKEASSEIGKTEEIFRILGDTFPVWCGNDDLIVPAAANGAKGVISVLSNLWPVETCALTDAALKGDFETAASLHRRLLPQIRALFCETNPIPIKYAMERIGFPCGRPRLPLTVLSQEHQKILDSLLP